MQVNSIYMLLFSGGFMLKLLEFYDLYCINGNIRPSSIFTLSLLLSAGKFKTRRIPMS